MNIAKSRMEYVSGLDSANVVLTGSNLLRKLIEFTLKLLELMPPSVPKPYYACNLLETHLVRLSIHLESDKAMTLRFMWIMRDVECGFKG
ncbi:hypothetical protein F2Q69_00008820 [Brassica cretica]|uniref:Uncharacterized protein n=1 Tax=Brassica cretica TaxID=69181 RepID=A0A8S9P1P0_BRACR|nr:hypothetical protein F2Q69_00008820 [Brassica cretica]